MRKKKSNPWRLLSFHIHENEILFKIAKKMSIL